MNSATRQQFGIPRGTVTKLERRLAKEFSRGQKRVSPAEIKERLKNGPELLKSYLEWYRYKMDTTIQRRDNRVEPRRAEKLKPQTLKEREAARLKKGEATKKLGHLETNLRKLDSKLRFTFREPYMKGPKGMLP